MIGQNAACLAVAELDPKSVSAKKDQDPTSQSTPPLVVETAAKILKAKHATPQRLTPAPCGHSGRVGHPAGRLQFDSILFASVCNHFHGYYVFAFSKSFKRSHFIVVL